MNSNQIFIKHDYIDTDSLPDKEGYFYFKIYGYDDIILCFFDKSNYVVYYDSNEYPIALDTIDYWLEKFFDNQS